MRKLFSAVAMAMIATIGPAEATTYICKVKPDRKGGWIPETLIIEHDEKSGEVLVYDEIIKTFNDKPLQAKIAENNKKRITYKWTLPEMKLPHGPTILRFEFRASYLKPSHRVVISSHPAGFVDEFTGRGKCRIARN